VQLFWLSVFAGREGAGVPFFWVVLFCVVAPMAFTQFGMLAFEGDGDDGYEQTRIAFIIYGVFFVVMTSVFLLTTTRKYGHLLRYVVLFDNCTYFFNTIPAYYWCLVLPGYMAFTGSIPFTYTFFILVPGGFLWEVLTYIQVVEVKGWSRVEGKRPEDISILRSQQMYFVNTPLHGVALYSGTMSAIRILFKHHDASSWSSFGSGGPGDWIVNWLHFLVGFEVACILAAAIQLGLNGLSDVAQVLAYLVGAFTASLFLALVFDPYMVLVTGSTKTLTLKHAYLGFWVTMFVLGLIIFINKGYIDVDQMFT